MIRLTAMLKRLPSLTHEEFVAHWREQHGPLIRDIPELARHFVRYEQHPIGDDRFGVGGFDGMAVQWFDSIEDFEAFIAEPAYAETVMPDEARFLDMGAIAVAFTDEPTVIVDNT